MLPTLRKYITLCSGKEEDTPDRETSQSITCSTLKNSFRSGCNETPHGSGETFAFFCCCRLSHNSHGRARGRDSFIRCLLKAISGGEIWTCFAPYLVCSCFLPAQMSKWSLCIHVLSVDNIKHQLHCSKLLFKSAKFKVIRVHNGSSSLVILMINVWWRFAIQNAGKLRKTALRFGLCFAFRHTMGLKTSFQIPLVGLIYWKE